MVHQYVLFCELRRDEGIAGAHLLLDGPLFRPQLSLDMPMTSTVASGTLPGEAPLRQGLLLHVAETLEQDEVHPWFEHPRLPPGHGETGNQLGFNGIRAHYPSSGPGKLHSLCEDDREAVRRWAEVHQDAHARAVLELTSARGSSSFTPKLGMWMSDVITKASTATYGWEVCRHALEMDAVSLVGSPRPVWSRMRARSRRQTRNTRLERDRCCRDHRNQQGHGLSRQVPGQGDFSSRRRCLHSRVHSRSPSHLFALWRFRPSERCGGLFLEWRIPAQT